MQNSRLFKGSIPTDVDVELLRQKFGVPDPGQTILYTEIEKAINQPHQSNRWRSIVTAWRKKLDRESNILLRAEPRKGFVAMDGHSRVDYSTSTFRGGLRRVAKAALVAVRTDRDSLDPEETRALDHVQKVAGAIRTTAAVEARKLRYPEPGLRAIG